jgi:hypothetical protein
LLGFIIITSALFIQPTVERRTETTEYVRDQGAEPHVNFDNPHRKFTEQRRSTMGIFGTDVSDTLPPQPTKNVNRGSTVVKKESIKGSKTEEGTNTPPTPRKDSTKKDNRRGTQYAKLPTRTAVKT